MKKGLIVIISMLALLVSLTGIAGATGSITVDQLKKEVPLGGTTVFKVNATSADIQHGIIKWDTESPLITGNFTGTNYTQNGSSDVVSLMGNDYFLFTVKVNPNAQVGKLYNIPLSLYTQDGVQQLKLQGLVTAGVVPIPELNSGVLISAGLVGLLGLVRLKRKN